MEFLVTRTSNWSYSEKPCDEVYEKEYEIKWSDGVTKKVHGWFIQVNTLAELIEFTDKYGEIVIGKSDMNQEIRIEIYDGYRE